MKITKYQEMIRTIQKTEALLRKQKAPEFYDIGPGYGTGLSWVRVGDVCRLCFRLNRHKYSKIKNRPVLDVGVREQARAYKGLKPFLRALREYFEVR